MSEGRAIVPMPSAGILVPGGFPGVSGPTLPTVVGLLGWWKADAIPPVADGTAIQTWADSHTSAKDLTQATAANRPTYRTSVINGKPVVRFDGVDDVMDTPFAITTTTCSFYMVLKHVTIVVSTNGATFYRAGTNSGDHILDGIVAHFSTTTNAAARGGLFLSQITRPAVGTSYLYTTIFDGANNTAYLNGTAATPAAIAGAFGPAFFRVGGAYYTTAEQYESNIDVGEMLIYNVAHDATTRAAVEAYLKTKWGLP